MQDGRGREADRHCRRTFGDPIAHAANREIRIRTTLGGYALRLTRDDLPAGATPRTLPALNRVLYVLAGDLTVATGGKEARLAEHSASFAGGAITPAVGPRGATVLRYELVREGAAPDAAGTLLLEHPIELAAESAVSDALRSRRLRLRAAWRCRTATRAAAFAA